MFRGHIWKVVLLSAILISGCSKLPGLRVLTGQDAQGNNVASTDQTVQALDLVMADKTGATDPGMTAAADRIEAADTMLDIIEVRKNADTRVFTVNMLFAPPQIDTSTAQGQIDQLNTIRRAFELTWQGMMSASSGTDQLQIRLLQPGEISTLDHGRSFVGVVIVEATIDRSAAAKYLAGQRNANTFYDMVLNGTLNYQRPTAFTPYEGTPNHPMFMLSTAQQ
jgi:hypothetical protein